MNHKESLKDLTSLVQILRGPDGCPWDREQKAFDLKSYLVGELYELLDAIDQDHPSRVKEETGDLLFLLIFLIEIFREQGAFDLDEVVSMVSDKMVRRHPHVFGNAKVTNSQEVKANWRMIKKEEGKPIADNSLLDNLPEYLPALVQAQSLTTRASRVGFDWSTSQEIISKVEEEIKELRTGINTNEPDDLEEELGDLLFTLVNLARFLKVDAEKALRKANKKFLRRFRYIEASLLKAGKSIEKTPLEEMDKLWEEAKQAER